MRGGDDAVHDVRYCQNGQKQKTDQNNAQHARDASQNPHHNLKVDRLEGMESCELRFVLLEQVDDQRREDRGQEP